MSEDHARPWAAPGHERRGTPAPSTGVPHGPPSGHRPAPAPAGDDRPAEGRGPAPLPGGPVPVFAVDERHRQRVFAGPGYTSPAYRNDRVAVAALVLGIVGVVVPGVCLLAVALGHLGVHRGRGSHHGGRGLAVAGLVLGYIMTVAWLAAALLRLVLNAA